MKIRNVRSKEIEFDVDPKDPPALGAEVKLTISMGGTTIERTYRVTWIEMRSAQVVVVKAKGDGTDA